MTKQDGLKLRKWKGWAFALLTIGLTLLLVFFTESFQGCIHHAAQHVGSQTLKERVFNFIFISNVYMCSAEFIHENAEAITAIFTLVLAFSTIRLWITTRDLFFAGEKQIGVAKETADAAKLNAQAVINAERAHLFVVIGKENITTQIPNAVGAAPHRIDEAIPAFLLPYAFKNYGKTPATIQSIIHGAMVAPDLPQKGRVYDTRVIDMSTMTLGAQDTSPSVNVVDLLRLKVKDARLINDGATTFWFYGIVIYDDVFGWRRTMNFVWHYNVVSNTGSR